MRHLPPQLPVEVLWRVLAPFQADVEEFYHIVGDPRCVWRPQKTRLLKVRKLRKLDWVKGQWHGQMWGSWSVRVIVGGVQAGLGLSCLSTFVSLVIFLHPNWTHDVLPFP